MTTSSIKTLNHCTYALSYHLVLVTRYRRRVLSDAMVKRFKEMAKVRCEAWGGELIECESDNCDHVHLLIELPPTAALSDFVNALKTGTSRILRKEFGEQLSRFYTKPVLWSRSYFVSITGGANIDTVKNYVASQGQG